MSENPDFKKISFACFALMATGVSLNMGLPSLIKNDDDSDANNMTKSWLISVQTTTLITIALFILSVSSFVFGNYLASLPILFITLIKIFKIGQLHYYKKQLTTFALPDMFTNFETASNGLFILMIMFLYKYSIAAFSRTEQAKSTPIMRILLIILSLIYCIINFGIIRTILHNYITEG